MLTPPLPPRHAESCDHATIGRGNIFRLWKEKDWITVEFVENIIFMSMKSTFMDGAWKCSLTGVPKSSKLAKKNLR